MKRKDVCLERRLQMCTEFHVILFTSGHQRHCRVYYSGAANADVEILSDSICLYCGDCCEMFIIMSFKGCIYLWKLLE